MTVGELIEYLSTLDSSKEIVVAYDGQPEPIEKGSIVDSMEYVQYNTSHVDNTRYYIV